MRGQQQELSSWHLVQGWLTAASTVCVCVCVHEAGLLWCPAGLCHAGSRVLVSFELRSSAVKETFLAEAHKEFSQVR